MKKLGIWLLLPALIMGTWAGPTLTSADAATGPSQALSVARQSTNPAQIEATPMVTEPETPAPASSDPASTSPAKDAGSTTVAPSDFPNVCDKSASPQMNEVGFGVDFPVDDTTSTLEVRVFAENGGCIPGWGYAGPVLTFEASSSGVQVRPLPDGRYVYEYSGKGFESKSYIPFQVTEGRPVVNDQIVEHVRIRPVPIPASQTVMLNVTIPDGGSSMTIVISDQNGTVEAFTASKVGLNEFTTKLPVRGGEYDYYYEYWGDDYPWSDRIPFQVLEGQETVIDIAPTVAAITLTPSQAPAGTDVKVHVGGFRAGDEYEINFNNGQVVVRSDPDKPGDRVDSEGNITRTFTVPAGLAPGKYPVVVTGAVSGQRVEATLTVAEAAQVTVEPASAPASDVVLVSGSGFAPGQVVTIRFGGVDGQVVGYRTANPDGSFSGRITIPKTTAVGEYQVVASQENGPGASVPFNVTSRVVSVSVSPSSVSPGTVVTVTGSGYAPKEMVDIYWETTGGLRLGYLAADSSGSFTGRVTVPKTAGTGNYPIQVRGRTSSATGSATVSVTAQTPQVTVSPAIQTSGKVVSVSGTQFTPGNIVDIRWNTPDGRLLGYVKVSSSGTVSGRVTVPAGTVPGDYNIVMIERGSTLSGTARITVTGATVTVVPTQASPGTVVTVSGSGFGPGEIVDIRWNGPSGKLLGYRTTSSSGSMSGRVTIPADAAPGTYTLHLQGRNSDIVGSVQVEVTSAASTGDRGTAWRPVFGSSMGITDHAWTMM